MMNLQQQQISDESYLILSCSSSSNGKKNDRENEIESSQSRSISFRKNSAYATAGHVPSSSEPTSSISDMSQEEDVAYCLMMLSRDKWTKKRIEVIEGDEEEGRENFGVVKMKKTRTRGKYICESCNRVFRSYQALGGHIASHKKIKVVTSEASKIVETAKNEVKIHECSVCYRVFSSGQALGGHKRSHAIASRYSVLLK
ncbi:hypothetical protein RDI58_024251 [Solanum bulbocastanum]|uniref:C2H2-type domain-containing protein n=1 Tax=Solanum bulbocastanum TaxID=147425 RepID=A0AAN8Y349_SOLBU